MKRLIGVGATSSWRCAQLAPKFLAGDEMAVVDDMFGRSEGSAHAANAIY
jgi:hypothetical protein